MTSVFEDYETRAWPFRYSLRLHFLSDCHGGTPTDSNVAESWIRQNMGETNEAILRELVQQAMEERNVTEEVAIKYVNELRHLNGFKRDDKGLYLEGRLLKSNLKEAAVIALSTNRIPNKNWGVMKKSLKPFLAEHLFVVEQRLHFQDQAGEILQAPTGVSQSFVHTFRGSSMKYEEYVTDAYLDATIKTDQEFSHENWAQLFLTAGQIGLGASRSQGFGVYEVVQFDPA